ncbi:4a-hydroxytetrahydrobiopterin dehydratase [Arthrobacter sp. LAPM80]|uniref:4a-hydroxytetrahydrobiopterin dehydratase n=1 Tax=Arthrobacter sp. LAPM80 TaxID=3141788 RepID=UPI00398A6235
MAAEDVLTRAQIDEELQTLPQWRLTGELRTVLKCPTSAIALDLFSTIGQVAQKADHHPDLDWRYDTLFVATSSHDAGGQITARDISLARAISTAASAAGAVARPDLIRTFDIVIDTADKAAISTTWKGGFGYVADANGDLSDPHGRGPGIWFQETGTPNPNRFHVDVNVPFSERETYLAALADSGGSLDDDYAPRWVVATDAQGNRMCICTEAEA